MTLYVLSIDPGIINCAFVVLSITFEPLCVEILESHTKVIGSYKSTDWIVCQVHLHHILNEISSRYCLDYLICEEQPYCIDGTIKRIECINVVLFSGICMYATARGIKFIKTNPKSWHAKYLQKQKKSIRLYKSMKLPFIMIKRRLLQSVHEYDAMFIATYQFNK